MTYAHSYGDGYRDAVKHAGVERQIALRLLREQMQGDMDALKKALREIIAVDQGQSPCTDIARKALGE
jgi:hypothetical protein